MSGSEKQIKWAEEIKASFVDTLKGADENSFFNKLNHVGANKVNAGKLTPKQVTGIVKMFNDALTAVLSNDSAKFWIDNRNQMDVEQLFPYLPEWAQRHTPAMVLDNAAKQ